MEPKEDPVANRLLAEELLQSANDLFAVVSEIASTHHIAGMKKLKKRIASELDFVQQVRGDSISLKEKKIISIFSHLCTSL